MTDDSKNNDDESSANESQKDSTEEHIRSEEAEAKKGKPPTTMIAESIEVGAIEKSRDKGVQR